MNNLFEKIEKLILPYVEKPTRYIGNEINSIIKEHTNKIKVALIYPDIYEIGISNIGLKILYNILNSYDSIVCERAYAPWTDFENYLRKYNIPLYSLETKTPLNKFDILGFSFQYELLYTNFLNILDLSNIPFYNTERNDTDPFIIAGGPTVVNPEPLARFIDAFCIGDGESRIIEVVKTIENCKKLNISRNKILHELSKIDGIYVPILYKEEEKNGYIIPVGKTVNRFIEPDLESLPFFTKQIIPNTQAVQDRAVVEISRGCINGCRFCQAGYIYRPLRERSIPKILELARNAISDTGYREFSLISLSVSDYSDLTLLIENLHKQFSEHGISFSLPSLRIDSFTLELAKKVSEIRKSGLTFAIEAGYQWIRDSINKKITEEELINVLKIAKENGWNSVKLYFMIGLIPELIEKETEGIIYLCKKVISEVKNIKITASIATFIPKPHTPLQWNKQVQPEDIQKYFNLILKSLNKFKNINIRFNNPYISFLEGIFSRGDRKLSDVIVYAYKNGARFDSWNEKINIDIWNEAFSKFNISTDFYLNEKEQNITLPWNIINIVNNKNFLLKEKFNYENNILTQVCVDKCVLYCGVCNFTNIKNKTKTTKSSDILIQEDFLKNIKINTEHKLNISFVYTKYKTSKYLSGIELEEFFSRAFIRANIPIVFTKGFNPHIKLELTSPLPVGFSSNYEIAKIFLFDDIEIQEFIGKVNSNLPEGIKILKASKVNNDKLSKLYKEHIVIIQFNNIFDNNFINNNFLNMEKYYKITSKSKKIINLKNYILEIKINNDKYIVKYKHEEGITRIQDIINGLTGYDVKNAVTLEPIVLERLDLNGNNLL